MTEYELSVFKSVPDYATQYAKDVGAGKIIAGKMVRQACKRHLKDLKRPKKDGLLWRPELAARAYSFFATLLLAEGEHAGKPLILQPWQRFIVGSIFGWQSWDADANAYYRRFRTAYVEIGKGNGKSPLAAGIALYLTTCDDEPSAEVYFGAVTRSQAKICFRDAVRFVESTPELRDIMQVQAHAINYDRGGSFITTVSSEGRSLDGKRVHAAIIDELHEHPSAEVVDKMRAGTKGRRQALIFEITNSGYNRESVCYKHHEASQAVLNNTTPNDTWFSYVSHCDEGDDPLNDESVWVKANPNIGVSITRKYLREQVAEAKAIPTRRNIVLRLNFCEWTQSDIRWTDLDKWDKGDAKLPEVEELTWYAGLDLSTTTDLSALVLVAKHEGKVLVRPYFWTPLENIRSRAEKDRVPYDVWVREGYMRATEGNIVDYDAIRADINLIAERYRLGTIRYDRWNATQITTQLADDGFQMMAFGQGFASMSAPTKELERLIAGEQLVHGGNPVLRWMASNVVAQTDAAGNVKLDKGKSTERIDGIVALVMALAGLTTDDAEQEMDINEAIFNPLRLGN